MPITCKIYKVAKENGSYDLISADKLISDYVLNNADKEDADTIGWLLSLREKGEYDKAISFISDANGLDLKEI